MTELLALAAPWLTLANVVAVSSLFLFVGGKLSVFDRLVLDQSKAAARAQKHSGEIVAIDRRLVVLETIAERSKDLPDHVARLLAIVERIGDRE